MDPATIAVAIAVAQFAIKEAPNVIEMAGKMKEFFKTQFGGIMTAAQQDAVHEHLDEYANAALSGQVLPAWSVE